MAAPTFSDVTFSSNRTGPFRLPKAFQARSARGYLPAKKAPTKVGAFSCLFYFRKIEPGEPDGVTITTGLTGLYDQRRFAACSQ